MCITPKGEDQENDNENGFNYAIDLLFRLRKSHSDRLLFKTDDLRISSAYSLFRLVDDHLTMIDELGATETPEKIYIHDPNYRHYSSVKLVLEQTEIEYAKSDRENRAIGSYYT